MTFMDIRLANVQSAVRMLDIRVMISIVDIVAVIMGVREYNERTKRHNNQR